MSPLKMNDALPAVAGSVFFILLTNFSWDKTPFFPQSFSVCLGFLAICTVAGFSQIQPVKEAMPGGIFLSGRMLLFLLCGYTWTAGLLTLNDFNSTSFKTCMSSEHLYEIEAVLKGDGRDIGKGRQIVRADLNSIRTEDLILKTDCESLIIMDENQENIGWGSIILAEGSFHPTRDNTLIFFCNRLVLSGWNSPFFRVRKNILENLYREFQSLKPDSRSFVSALLLGFTPDRGSPLVRFFRNAGCMHLLALSGFHIGLIALALRYLVKPFGGFYVATVLSTLGAVAFLFLVGIRPSLVRAVMMYVLWAWHTLRHRKVNALQVLSWVFILQLSLYPRTVSELSFQLSYTALFGILMGGRNLMFLFRRWSRVVPAGIIAVGIGAQLMTLPLIIQSFGIWRPVGILAAPILTPLVTASMGLGGLLFCSLWLPDPVSRFITGLMEQTIFLTTSLSAAFYRAPGLVISGAVAWLAALGSTIIPLYLIRRIRREPHIPPEPRFPRLNPSLPGKSGSRSKEALGAELPYKQRRERKDRPTA